MLKRKMSIVSEGRSENDEGGGEKSVNFEFWKL